MRRELRSVPCYQADELGRLIDHANLPDEMQAISSAAHAFQGDLADAVTEIRAISNALAPIDLQQLGLSGAITLHVGRLEELASGVSLSLEIAEGLDREPSEETSVTAYRIVQEVLNNAIRHAQPTHVSIKLSRGGGLLTIDVDDDGSGFDTSKESEGMGLRSMTDRAKLVGGSIEIGSNASGTTIRVVLPLTERAPTV